MRETAPTAAGGRRVRVVLVDDHRLVVDAITRVLAAEAPIEVVGSARTLRELTDLAVRPDVVLMDYLLPDGTGAEGVRLAKQKWRHARVLMLTAVQEDETILETVRAGADGYLTKDRALAEVVAAVHAAARGVVLLPRSVLTEIARRVGTTRGAERAFVEPLTPRELEVLRALANGESSAQIAERLSISVATLRTHVRSILRKLDAHSKLEAVAVALRLGLVSSPGRTGPGVA